MKLKKDLCPAAHVKSLGKVKLMFGGTFRKNLGFHALIAGFTGLAVFFAVISAGTIAVYQLMKYLRQYLRSQPFYLSLFFGFVAALNAAAAYLKEQD